MFKGTVIHGIMSRNQSIHEVTLNALQPPLTLEFVKLLDIHEISFNTTPDNQRYVELGRKII